MSLRDAVNAALRSGLQHLSSPANGKRKAYKTPVFHAERFLAGDLTNTSEMLAVAEGEAYR